jgi:hypothetical protein
MADYYIHTLTTASPANTDVIPFSAPGSGPAYKATLSEIVVAGLNVPNSASAGAGANILFKAPDGVTSGAGGSLVFQAGVQATTGGNGYYRFLAPADSTVWADITIAARAGGYTDFIVGYYSTKKTYYQFTGIGIRGSGTNSWMLSYDGSVSKIGLTFVTAGGVWFAPTYDDTGHDTGIQRGTVGVIRISNASTGGGSLAFTPSTPAALSANTDNLVLDGSGMQRLSASTPVNLTGIAPPTGGVHVGGRSVRLWNVGANTITIKHQVTSTAANQFFCSTAADLAWGPDKCLDIQYDDTIARWRAVLLP